MMRPFHSTALGVVMALTALGSGCESEDLVATLDDFHDCELTSYTVPDSFPVNDGVSVAIIRVTNLSVTYEPQDSFCNTIVNLEIFNSNQWFPAGSSSVSTGPYQADQIREHTFNLGSFSISTPGSYRLSACAVAVSDLSQTAIIEGNSANDCLNSDAFMAL